MIKIRRRKICVITQSNGWGGAEAHTLELIKYLVSQGFFVEYVSCGENYIHSDYADLDRQYFKMIHAELSIFNPDKKLKQPWLKTFQQIESRTVIFPHLNIGYGSLVFINACRKFFKKLYVIEHTFPEPMPAKTSRIYFKGCVKGLGLWWYKKLRERILVCQCADGVATVSDDVRDKLIKECMYQPWKTFTVHNGVDWKKYQSIDIDKTALKDKYSIPSGAKVFGILGRLSYEKGVDMAVESFRIFMENNPDANVYMFLVGDGPDRSNLQNLVDQYQLTNRVIFTGFLENPSEILPLFDCILATSRREGLPLALLEAMASGCLPIVFRVGGMPEVVNHKDLGWVVDPGDVSGFARAMEESVQLDEDQVACFKKKILKRIQNHFDDKKSFQKIVDVFDLNGFGNKSKSPGFLHSLRHRGKNFIKSLHVPQVTVSNILDDE